jgi:antitoxin MazE
MADVRLWLDQPVETREEHGRVVIQPAREVADDLGALVAAITDANCHAVVEAGPAVGREAW